MYFYNARYYDATIGRFISADPYVQDYTDPQTLNRYSYCNNNPLKYTDPTGNFWDWIVDVVFVVVDVVELVRDPSWENAGLLVADVALGVLPFVPSGAGVAARATEKVAAELVEEGAEQLVKNSDVLYEITVKGTKNTHAYHANKEVYQAAKENPEVLARLQRELGSDDIIGHMESGKGKLINPPGAEWHHPTYDRTKLQLIEKNKHRGKDNFLKNHDNGVGGFKVNYGGRQGYSGEGSGKSIRVSSGGSGSGDWSRPGRGGRGSSDEPGGYC